MRLFSVSNGLVLHNALQVNLHDHFNQSVIRRDAYLWPVPIPRRI
jgi:hypothetical protein